MSTVIQHASNNTSNFNVVNLRGAHDQVALEDELIRLQTTASIVSLQLLLLLFRFQYTLRSFLKLLMP